jgi:hypothetical protein
MKSHYCLMLVGIVTVGSLLVAGCKAERRDRDRARIEIGQTETHHDQERVAADRDTRMEVRTEDQRATQDQRRIETQRQRDDQRIEGRAQVDTDRREARVDVDRDRQQQQARIEVDRDRQPQQQQQRAEVRVDQQRQDQARIAADRADIVAGHEQVEQRVANNIRGTLATITEASLTRQQLRSVVQRLSSEDRERIGDFADREFPELDQLIAQFQQQWQNRYGQEFNIDQRELVYHPEQVQIVYGWTQHAQLARERQPGEIQQRQQERREGQPQPAQPQGAQPGAQQPQQQGATAQQQQQQQGAAQQQQADQQQNEQRNQATVVIPASHGLPELSIPMVNEGTIMDAWRIDAPAHLDGQRLQQNLMQQLQQALQAQQQWPADVNEAYLMVTHHVLVAVMDAADPQGAQPAAGQAGQQQQRQPMQQDQQRQQQNQQRNQQQ